LARKVDKNLEEHGNGISGSSGPPKRQQAIYRSSTVEDDVRLVESSVSALWLETTHSLKLLLRYKWSHN